MINIPKGVQDVLPQDSYKWKKVQQVAYDIANKYNLKEIKTPIFEHTELFLRGVGSSTDIVNKEMYTFLDKGERSLTLKPEGTAGVVRSFIENSMYNEPLPIKMFYITNCFRYEKPQRGRLRQHTQFGCEIFGADTVQADVEAILIATNFYRSFGINPVAYINNLGCAECRKKYAQALKNYFAKYINTMCPDCQKRFETNPLRILDCKVEDCKKIVANAPKIGDVLCDDCKNNFNKLQELLKSANVNFKVNNMLVRGLDYYTNLVFEFVDEDKKLGQNALGGGGRYNNLVEELGGKSTPVVGFGIGIERLLLYLEDKGIEIEKDNNVDVYIASLTDNLSYVINVAETLRKLGLKVEMDIVNRSLKAQFKYANKLEAKYVITICENEILSKKLSVKNMQDGNQYEVSVEEVLKGNLNG